MFPPEGAELAHATMKRTSSGVGPPVPGRGIRTGIACTGARGTSGVGAGASGTWRPSAVSSSRSA